MRDMTLLAVWLRSAVALVAVLLAPAVSAEVVFSWVTVAGAGNSCDVVTPVGCFGAVSYEYEISQFEVTNAQYAEFLNAVAATDQNNLYDADMATSAWPTLGGITQSDVSGSFTYNAISGRGAMPVHHTNKFDALRFANWLHNGQPTGAQGSATTEDGAYTITAQGVLDNSITRNVGAAVFLTSEDEWYKAAYYDSGSTTYFNYPTGTDTQVVCAVAGATANTANCGNILFEYTDVGSYTNSISPFGSFDQAGNVWEWTEAVSGVSSIYRGGAINSFATNLSELARFGGGPTLGAGIGFRVARIASAPPPAVPLFGTITMMLLVGALGFLGITRTRELSSPASAE